MKSFGIAVGTMIVAAALSAAQTVGVPVAINGRVPLGLESFRLEPSKQNFYLMASLEDPVFLGLRRTTGVRSKLITTNGEVLTAYPERVEVRLTASSREKLIDDHPFDTRSDLPLDQLLTGLKFRLKIFHGLKFRYVEPLSVEDVGVPRDLPYNERIYRIAFDMGKVPIEDRVVMEVLTPGGERLCKFHLDLL